jgi:hypothetical protein
MLAEATQQEIIVKVFDGRRNLLTGVNVSFSISSGEGGFNPHSAVTDADGASTVFTSSDHSTSNNYAAKTVTRFSSPRVRARDQDIYMYYQTVNSSEGPLVYRFRDFITDDQLTTIPTVFDSAVKVEDWLTQQGSDLRFYSQSGQSASTIIFNAASTKSINPTVILTTLQKEQGLITASSSSPNYQQRLNWAMGYGPQPSNFLDQLNNGTGVYRTGFNTASAYTFPHAPSDKSSFWYNAQSGTVKVWHTVENAATWAMYEYNPEIRTSANSGGLLLFYIIWVGWNFQAI